MTQRKTPSPIRSDTDSPSSTDAMRCCWKSCDEPFDSPDQLARHISAAHAVAASDGLFYCRWSGCARAGGRGFNARYKMLVHVRTHTNERPHRCPQCDKSFSRAENLKIHTRSHSGEKPYACPVPGCTKAYSNSSDRFKHTRTHQVDKPYRCKVPGCEKRYTDPSSLRKHVKTYKHGHDSFFKLDPKTVEVCQDKEWFYPTENQFVCRPFGADQIDVPLDLSVNSKVV